jgi:hypothetical protein
MRRFYCDRVDVQHCRDGGPSGEETPIRTAGLVGPGGGTLAVNLSDRAPGEDVIGVPDPGALGDAGILTRPATATRPPAREEIPFTGLSLWGLAAAGLLFVTAGALTRVTVRQ